MSASPPPPPFRAAPNPYTGGYDRRMLRAQRRAAKAAQARQTTLMRAQMRAARRTSSTGPVLLIALGIVFLLLELGRLHWQPLLVWFGRWWPLVLVGAGIVLLLEWAWDRREQAPLISGLQPRRTLGGGTAFLLTLLALTGAVTTTAENRAEWLHRNLQENFNTEDMPWWDWIFRNQPITVANLSAPLTKDSLLTVTDPRGKITVTGSSTDGQVHITVQRHSFTWRGEGADQDRSEGARLEPASGGLSFKIRDDAPGQTDLTIQMPHETAFTLTGSHGEVSLSELHGRVDVQDHTGDVQITAVAGAVHLLMRDDNASVTGHSLSGGLTVEGRSGDLTLSDVNGPVNLHGDFFGTTHLERVRGEVRFTSSFTNFACSGIAGELTVEGRNELEAAELIGPVTLATSDRNLTLSGIRAGATITDSNGSVKLTMSDPLGPVHVSTTDGSVTLNIPDHAAFALSARTNDGQMKNDFGLTSEQHGDHTALSGQVRGGGPAITLETTEGDVTVQKSSGSDWTSDDADTSGRIQPVPKDTSGTTHSGHVQR